MSHSALQDKEKVFLSWRMTHNNRPNHMLYSGKTKRESTGDKWDAEADEWKNK